MRETPLLKGSGLVGCLDERLAAGWDLRSIRCGYLTGKGEERRHLAAVISFGGGCPPSGCIRCDRPGCFYGDFIRGYWNHPKGD